MPAWLSEAVAEFGEACKAKLAGPGDKEAAIRAPLEDLLKNFGEKLGLKAVFHDEVRDEERRVRPDYGVSIDGAISGYIEVKAPGRGIDPAGFKGHDLEQWERQRDLPNLLYTNGTEWRLFRDSEQVGEPVHLDGGSLAKAGPKLQASLTFEELVTDFLRWEPAPIGNVSALVQAIAPLTRLLRSDVLEQLAAEEKAVKAGSPAYKQPFLGLAADWRRLLFPHASDEVFADGYAQTVTFALLLARSEEIELDGTALHTIGDELGEGHSLMGRALQLLTDTVATDFKVTLDLLVRVVGAVDWPHVRAGKRDTYLHLYERFLEEYDPKLRQESGSYYTPIEVVEQMVRLTDEVLVSRLGTMGFGDERVLTVDPAMGTGTFLQAVIDRAADRIKETHGPGMVRGLVTDLAKRLVGFELQTGPFAVAELRTTDILRSTGATPPPDGMRLYVTDTLDDPYAEIEQLASGLGAISDSRRQANVVKRETPVTVVIGNPPYRERAEGEGGWIEMGSEALRSAPASKRNAPLDDFKTDGIGAHAHNLKNLYVYFWRWATWKVFDALPDKSTGVVCFISTSGYIGGPGFKGMREYLRRTCSEGWILDVSPEGMRPSVSTRLFPGVQQPLAIGIFVRDGLTEPNTPATIRYLAIGGKRAEKFKAIADISVQDGAWREARTDWQSAFTPTAESEWDVFPALDDLLPWTSPGCTGNRRWPYAPAQEILARRWMRLNSEQDANAKKTLFKVTGDRSLAKKVEPLPGVDTSKRTESIDSDTDAVPTPVRLGYRTFDRQWIIPDNRVLDRPRPDLWRARIPGQVFAVELHSKPLADGPGIVFSALIPDLHFFKGSEGGRTLPMLHPDGTPNLAPGLVPALEGMLKIKIDSRDVVAYLAGAISHPSFTERFSDELTTPGVRIPLTRDPVLWTEAVQIGQEIIWLHTYGEQFANDSNRPSGNIRFAQGDPRQPLSVRPIGGMPNQMSYDANTKALRLGDGEWGPIGKGVVHFSIDQRNVLDSWFNYRKLSPGGKKTSPLDDIHVEQWPSEWTIELIDLLTVLTRLVELEPKQADLLDRIMAGPIATMDELAELGVKWPKTKKDRAPRRAAFGSGTAQQPTLGDPE